MDWNGRGSLASTTSPAWKSVKVIVSIINWEIRRVMDIKLGKEKENKS